VPIQDLIDFLEGGEPVDEFLALYPSFTPEQVMAVFYPGSQPSWMPSRRSNRAR